VSVIPNEPLLCGQYFARKFLLQHKLRVSQSLWKQNAPSIINVTLEAILSLFNRNLLMYSRHAKDLIKLVTDHKESLSTRMFHNTDRSDSLKGTENLTGAKTIWATEIRSIQRELKARSKNENLV